MTVEVGCKPVPVEGVAIDLSTLPPYLERLESLIDLSHVAATRDLQRRAFAFEPVDHIPTVIHYPVPESEWPQYSFAEIFADPCKMLLDELRDVYAGAKLGDDRLYGIRANYGTGIVASLFGSPTVTFDDSLPIGVAVDPAHLERILESDVPDLRSGLGGRALDTVAFYRKVLRPYPKLAQVVGSALLDIQGPFDNASILWGSGIFAALYDAPDRVARLMDLVVRTTGALVVAHRQIDGCPLDEQDGAWNGLGGLCVRDDSSINLSPHHYREHVKPYDERLLAQYGGWIHFCGRAAWWQDMLDLPGLRGINPYQGEFYDLYAMYERCAASRIAIVQWTTAVDERCRARIRTGFSRILWTDSYESACRARDHLAATGHADGYA